MLETNVNLTKSTSIYICRFLYIFACILLNINKRHTKNFFQVCRFFFRDKNVHLFELYHFMMNRKTN